MRPKGLWIAPPLKGIQFIPSLPAPDRKALPATTHSKLTHAAAGLFGAPEMAGAE